MRFAADLRHYVLSKRASPLLAQKKVHSLGELMNVGDLISLDELEREHIRLVIGKTKNLGEAARVLGIDAATLYRKRKRWGMPKDGGLSAAPEPAEAHAHAGPVE